MRHIVSRRRALATLGATALGSAFPAIVRSQTRQLVIGGPGGQEAQTRKFLIPLFEKQYNCKVLYDGAQTLPNVQKVQANPQHPPFDVVMMDEPGTIILAEQKLLEPMQASRIRNMSKLASGAVVKDGQWVVYMNAAIAIGYNTNGLKGGIPSWTLLWDPSLRERVMIPHPKTTQAPAMLAIASHLETGKPLREAQYDMDAAFRKLKQMKPNLLQAYLASAQASILLEKGEAWAAPGFFTTYVLDRKAAGAPVDMAYPKECSFAYPKVMAKVRNAPSPDLADAWIDACLSPEWQRIWMREFYSAPTNLEVPIAPGLIASKDLIVLDMEWHTKRIAEVAARFDREINA
jgi:putative spermidine/putrescine transport system substrate-binding protein